MNCELKTPHTWRLGEEQDRLRKHMAFKVGRADCENQPYSLTIFRFWADLT